MDAKFQILKFHTLKFQPKFPQNFVTPILYIETSNVRMSRQNLPAKNMASQKDILAGDAIKSTITHHTLSRTDQGLPKHRQLARRIRFGLEAPVSLSLEEGDELILSIFKNSLSQLYLIRKMKQG